MIKLDNEVTTLTDVIMNSSFFSSFGPRPFIPKMSTAKIAIPPNASQPLGISYALNHLYSECNLSTMYPHIIKRFDLEENEFNVDIKIVRTINFND